ncbi:MAG: hypothetical protein GXP15_03490 [Gammaproteobacteria bacterium]|nr:hypothetical protein [Gammaproteobacteria bacterium]
MSFERNQSIAIVGIAVGLLMTSSAAAHHSAAAYDLEKNVAVSGVVRSFSWRNPHTLVSLAVTDKDGSVVIWKFEGNGASNLVRNGWKRSMLKVGDHVTIHANPMKNGHPGGRLQGATLADGELVGQK